MRIRGFIFLLVLCTNFLFAGAAQAWWNEDWPNRVKININTQSLAEMGEQPVTDAAVLVRLHTGNFADFFFFNQDISDLRFIDADDMTPLKYHVEKFDLINQMMFVWVKLPKIASTDQGRFIHMYYGNQNAVAAEDKGGSLNVNRVAALHFDGSNNVVVDSSAYTQNVQLNNAVRQAASLIGPGITLDGNASVDVLASPSLQFLPEKGFAFSAWIKPTGMQQDAWLFHHKTSQGELTLGVQQSQLYARWAGLDGQVIQTPATALLTPESWQQVALNIDAQRMAVFVNGIEMASIDASLPAFDSASLTIGGGLDAQAMMHGFVGEMDELALFSSSRSPQWFVLASKTQGQVSTVLNVSEAEQLGSSGSTSYFATILKSVSLDGWLVIGSLMIMAVISWLVVVSKWLMLNRMAKDNKAFMDDFHKLTTANTTSLDAKDDEEEYEDSDFLNTVFGKHDHYQSSPIYQLYHQGVHELNQRMGKSVGARAAMLLSPQSISAIRATLDAIMVRQSQKLNGQMVLLTIAISGGPFLGLLGTVLGVMITFAAIAASGDVNINAIAPGVSAALMTTVAGLFVAIPALFAYNYLSVRIKDMIFDMDVFVDEFISKIAEQHS